MRIHAGTPSASLSVLICGMLFLLFTFLTETRGQEGYQKPPKRVLDVLDAPPPPAVVFSPTHERMLLVQGVNYPSIADLAEPMLRLAGLRINPRTNGPHRPLRWIGYTLQTVADGKPIRVALPAHAYLSLPSWSPDGKHFAFSQTTATGIELWIGDASSGAVRPVPEIRLNAVYGEPFHWMPGSQALLCKTVVAGRGQAPARPDVPNGPTVQESSGKSGPVRTYQDLLKNKHDEDLFDYYATSQLVLVDLKTLRSSSVGKPAVVASAEPAPDGKHLLVVSQHRPYSYVHPAYAFPKEVEVWDQTGQRIYHLTSQPLEDQVPIDGVVKGPRAYHWHPTEGATLLWVEALDEGNPKKKVPYRDRLRMLRAPFQTQPVELAKLQHRYTGLTWEETGALALLREFDRDRRWARTFLLEMAHPDQALRVVWDRSAQDRYRDPGTPVLKTLPNGQQVAQKNGSGIYLIGGGATPQGDRPFLDRLDLQTLQTKRLFQSEAKMYETVVALLDNDASQFITRKESVQRPPNYFVRSGQGMVRPLTDFQDPTPQLRTIQKQLVTYQRADGVLLSFTLYLPPDYKPGQRLPTVVWAYPREYTDPDTAGQVSGSPNHFTMLRGPSHLFFLLEGYAILDGAAMPVVGDPETVNNTYVEQIVASAKAAIDKADALGVTDRNRVGVGGHSYGAFMTANLLAHSKLFQAGIARSGAYNRTLTPFGFQSERRTLWEAPDMYLKVSPFMSADKIKTPILLIHGEADNNPGTFPVQSERMYQAVRGNGGIVRYVTLPYESHGYQARESVEHTLYEMISWFDKYVKHAPVAAQGRSTP
ncbi:MAG TPA: prolyl oligopeptidase family serine peptidase [Gemmataceae bacterium]|nr:prolyl oligopeptidase family serine peptidase [Gemmataceae bacterium]